MTQNDEPIVLDPGSGATSVVVSLPAGPEVLSFPISLDQGGTHRFAVSFDPDPSALDGLPENNRGDAVTFVSGDGRVLIVEGVDGEGSSIGMALRQGGIEVVRGGADQLAKGIEFLNGFDAVILANLPRWLIDNSADAALRSYVHDLGGGLLMLGGDQSFGGGWIDSQTAKALPLQLDPPQQRQMVRAHSPSSCTRRTATRQLLEPADRDRRHRGAHEPRLRGDRDLQLGAGPGGINGSGWAFPMQEAKDKRAAIAAAKSMTVGDMPDFQSRAPGRL